MAEIVYIKSKTITLPNITVEEKHVDGVLLSHRLTANDGYVIYRTDANDTEVKIDSETGDAVIDPMTGLYVEVPVTYYFKQATMAISVPVEKWTWVAIPDNGVTIY